MMEPSELRSKLSGVIAFPVTPFTDDLVLDVDALRRNTAEMAEFPLAAIVAAGGTGEMYSLSIEEHRQVVEAVVQEVDGKMPVIAGTGFGAQIAVELAKQSADAGADGILCFPPYYPNAPFEGMLNYYRAVGESTSLGLLIYNRDWAGFSPGEVNRQRLRNRPRRRARWEHCWPRRWEDSYLRNSHSRDFYRRRFGSDYYEANRYSIGLDCL